MAHDERAHAKLSPSAAKRWRNCPASIRLSEGMPNESSIYAAEGTAAHELAERCLVNGYSASRFIGETFNGFVVDSEMAENVQTYLDYARSIIRPGDDFEVEVRFDLSHMIPGLFGTSDLVIYKPSTKTLYVIDLKYGVVNVDAIDNDQAKIYSMGAYYSKCNWDIEKILISIVQPRRMFGDPIQEWEVSTLDLMVWTEEIANDAARTVENSSPNPGEWCKYCPAAGICTGLREKVYAMAGAIEQDKGGITLANTDYTPERLAEILKSKPIIEAWLKSVDTLVKHEFKNGRPLPGFKEVSSRPVRKFSASEDVVVETVTVGLGISKEDLYTTPELITPAALEKVAKAYGFKGKKAEEAVNGLQYLLPSGDYEPLIRKESSGTSIVPEDDPRPSVSDNVDDLFEEIR